MITANDARKATQSGNAEIQRILKLLEEEINEAAERGEWGLVCYKNVPWDAVPVGSNPVPSPLQKSLIEELTKYGFSASMQRHGNVYTPRAYEFEDGIHQHQNYVLVIRW